ncbi:MAG: hypothetical protein RLO52_36820 [Sandaracinaceae bacterium]
MNTHLSIVIALSLSLAACGAEEDTAEPTTEATPTAEAAPASPEPAEEEAAPAEPALSLDPPAEGETTTLLSLREGFAANADAWTGQRVTVRAQFMSATRVGGTLNNVSLVVSREDYAEDRLAHSMMCAFGDDAPESVDLMQYAEVTVRGTVVERFGRAGLDDCEIVTD